MPSTFLKKRKRKEDASSSYFLLVHLLLFLSRFHLPSCSLLNFTWFFFLHSFFLFFFIFFSSSSKSIKLLYWLLTERKRERERNLLGGRKILLHLNFHNLSFQFTLLSNNWVETLTRTVASNEERILLHPFNLSNSFFLFSSSCSSLYYVNCFLRAMFASKSGLLCVHPFSVLFNGENGLNYLWKQAKQANNGLFIRCNLCKPFSLFIRLFYARAALLEQIRRSQLIESCATVHTRTFSIYRTCTWTEKSNST